MLFLLGWGGRLMGLSRGLNGVNLERYMCVSVCMLFAMCEGRGRVIRAFVLVGMGRYRIISEVQLTPNLDVVKNKWIFF